MGHDKLKSFVLKHFFSTRDNNLSGVCGITKKSLNALTGHRLIPIQEAVHNLEKLDLVICSDSIHEVGIKKHLDFAPMKKGMM